MHLWLLLMNQPRLPIGWLQASGSSLWSSPVKTFLIFCVTIPS